MTVNGARRSYRRPTHASINVTINVQLLCSTAGFPALTGTATVTAVVLDINDNSPQFSHANYDARVTENGRPGDVVARPSATDIDAGRNAHIRSVTLVCYQSNETT